MKKIVNLSGGLGNQLFQIAGAISVFKNADFTTEWSIGITNVNASGNPEVFDYNFPNSIRMLPKKQPTRLQRKLAHLILRRSSSRKIFPGKFTMRIITTLLSLNLTSYLKSFVKILYPANLDANLVISNARRSEYLIGFFHSDLWISSVANELLLDDIKPKSIEPYVVELQKLSQIKNPVIVHMRLGDYEKEESFGILPSRYYEKALDILDELGFSDEIWIFTNDIDKAKLIFPKKYEFRANWIPNFSDSSVQVLEAMRLGSAYVIGNSTFSWWAAKLAKNKAAKVIAPNPWFKSAPTHKDLLPQNWITIDPW
jgi:hypothetical protein